MISTNCDRLEIYFGSQHVTGTPDTADYGSLSYAPVLVDLSKNRSRRFCDTGNCGNRQHVAAYRERLSREHEAVADQSSWWFRAISE